jgi:hypothetical protein
VLFHGLERPALDLVLHRDVVDHDTRGGPERDAGHEVGEPGGDDGGLDRAEAVCHQMDRGAAVGGECADHGRHLRDLVTEGDVLELAVARAVPQAVVGPDDRASSHQVPGDLDEEALRADVRVGETVHDQDARVGSVGVAGPELGAADDPPLVREREGRDVGLGGVHLSWSCPRSRLAGRRAPCR